MEVSHLDVQVYYVTEISLQLLQIKSRQSLKQSSPLKQTHATWNII